MIETELKAMLTKEQYNLLESEFSYTDCVEQTNSYYTAPDNILKKHGITFRIRTIDGSHSLQIKKHRSKVSALQIAEETEFAINCIPEAFTEEEVLKYTGISTTAHLIGELSTIRKTFLVTDGVEVCLDKSTYLGCTDYEIEIEYTSEIPQEFLETLSGYGIIFNLPTPGKFSRFMNRLKITYLR